MILGQLRKGAEIAHYYKLPDGVFFLNVPDKAKLIYAFLLDLSELPKSKETGYVFPKNKTIATKFHTNTKTVERHLQTLERQGLIRIERQRGKPSKIYLLESTDKNVCTTTDRNVPTSTDKNVSTVQTKMSEPLISQSIKSQSYMSHKKTKNRIDGNHVASFDGDAYKDKAQNPNTYIYQKREGA